jgi:hypothetical protein
MRIIERRNNSDVTDRTVLVDYNKRSGQSKRGGNIFFVIVGQDARSATADSGDSGNESNDWPRHQDGLPKVNQRGRWNVGQDKSASDSTPASMALLPSYADSASAAGLRR